MRRLYLRAILVSSLVIIGLALACQQPPPPSPPDTRAADERAIREADAACLKAVTAQDVEAFVSFFAEDASVLPPNAPMVTGKESVRKWASEVVANPGFVASWQTTKVEVSRAGDLAYSTDTYQLTANNPKGKPVTDRGKEVIVWKKQPGDKWKTVIDIFNSDLPAPGASKR
jgi:ketosteroid isomerase-like protein